MPHLTAARLLPVAQPVIRPFTVGQDTDDSRLESAFEDLYDVDGDYDDIALYVTRAEGYRDE